MGFFSHNVSCFLSTSLQNRNYILKITSSRKDTIKQSYRYKCITHEFIALMLRVYLLKLQNKEKTQKLKILARLQTSENTQLIKTLSFFKKQNLSWGVFFLYSLFF